MAEFSSSTTRTSTTEPASTAVSSHEPPMKSDAGTSTQAKPVSTRNAASLR
jgi:hypothetical protein